MRTSSSLLACSFVTLSLVALTGMKNPRPVVGTILSSGSFQVDHNAGSGTATVLNGDEVETSSAKSNILMKNGVGIDLAPHSNGAIFTDHATLSSGTLRVKSGAAQFPVQSRNFVVTTTSPGTDATLQTAGSSLTVNVTSGGAQIASLAGETLAHLTPGGTLSFASIGAAPAAKPVPNGEADITMTGTLDSENGHYLVRDRFTNSVSEVQGEVSPKLLHKMVAVTGKTNVTEKSSVSQVDRVVHVSKVAPSDAAFGLPCAIDGAGGIAKRVVVDGVLSKVREHFMVANPKDKTYEVVGDVSDKELGSNIKEKGFVLPNRPTIRPAEGVVYLERKKVIMMASPCVGAIVGGSLVSSGAALIVPATALGAASVAPISF